MRSVALGVDTTCGKLQVLTMERKQHAYESEMEIKMTQSANVVMTRHLVYDTNEHMTYITCPMKCRPIALPSGGCRSDVRRDDRPRRQYPVEKLAEAAYLLISHAVFPFLAQRDWISHGEPKS